MGEADTCLEIGGLGEQMAPRPPCGALPARSRPDRHPQPGAAPSVPAGSTSPEPSPREKSPLCTCWWHRSLDSTRLRQAGTQEGLPGPPKHHTLSCFSLPGVTRASTGFPFAPRASLRGPACHKERGPVPREEGGGGSDTVAHTAPVPAHDLLSGQRHSVQPLAHRVGTETGNRESLTL